MHYDASLVLDAFQLENFDAINHDWLALVVRIMQRLLLLYVHTIFSFSLPVCVSSRHSRARYEGHWKIQLFEESHVLIVKEPKHGNENKSGDCGTDRCSYVKPDAVQQQKACAFDQHRSSQATQPKHPAASTRLHVP